ncbi:glycosyltransferase family 2 protein [Pseudidiomarina sediminum]|uniref:glycosyltransferase family 2 protein n=1 Tax=Pseudidiomarina sediminum TaxID=431675 RepID=UPI001C95DC09|nr:glycosyltransferase family 2 protein [Pseudidiomarina sediminum]MBY6064341.1 glycosyltransferase family 2 protein [Pseudidiomarina sediminum]
MLQRCFVIPIYNHHDTIAATVTQLLPYQLPIIIIDDGSDAATKEALAALQQQYPQWVAVHHLPVNTGKGGAVMEGLRQAHQRGLTHALQIDADGQHDANDIPRFWDCAAKHPEALISGAPQYDDSIPTARKIGRQITHFWVHIETLSLQVKDTMCGFRVYPVAATLATIEAHCPGARMDFDIEIMVRMYWRGIAMYFIPTKVIYPEGGRSHFQGLADNWRISKMHTRLFFGMLLRLPKLLARKWRRGTA